MKLERMIYSIGDTIRDFYLRPGSSDSEIIGQIFVDLCFDISKLRRFSSLKDLLSTGRASGRRPLIIDAGANIGASSVYFAAQCPAALVVAIEPEASNFQLLVANTKGMSVLPVPCALAATPGRMRVIDVNDGYWAFQTRPVSDDDIRDEDVSCVTINEIFEAHQDQCFPFIVKIDIEGGEKEVFQQNLEWMAITPLIIVELHDWLLPQEGTALPFLRSISRLNRDFVYIGENIFSISNDIETTRFVDS
jgi:FkbM family methyltransferase